MSKISENEIVWTSHIFDKDTQNKVKYLKKNDREEFEDSFYKNLEFGTGGMRGIMGLAPIELINIHLEETPKQFQIY